MPSSSIPDTPAQTLTTWAGYLLGSQEPCFWAHSSHGPGSLIFRTLEAPNQLRGEGGRNAFENLKSQARAWKSWQGGGEAWMMKTMLVLGIELFCCCKGGRVNTLCFPLAFLLFGSQLFSFDVCTIKQGELWIMAIRKINFEPYNLSTFQFRSRISLPFLLSPYSLQLRFAYCHAGCRDQLIGDETPALYLNLNPRISQLMSLSLIHFIFIFESGEMKGISNKTLDQLESQSADCGDWSATRDSGTGGYSRLVALSPFFFTVTPRCVLLPLTNGSSLFEPNLHIEVTFSLV